MKGEDRAQNPAPTSDFNRPPIVPRRCLLAGCERPVKARRLCTRDYRRWQLYGDPLAYPPQKPKRRRPPHAEVRADREAYARAREAIS